MPKYTENQVKQAIAQAISTGNTKAAAKYWDVPYSTLRHRLKGLPPKSKAQSHRQRLHPLQEECLASWVISQRDLGLAPTHSQLREFAQRIVAAAGDNRPIGQNWITGFLRRNPKVETVKAKPINSNRLEGSMTEKIKDFFEKLALPEIRKIPPQHRYNMDETGIMEGKGGNGLVLGRSDDDFVPLKVPGSCTWSSILETVNALGISLPPLVIFQGTTIQHNWFSENLEGYKNWNFTSSKNGWSSNEIALEWLKKIFIPLTKPAEPQLQLLILDCHGSHTTTDFMWECYNNDIRILYLPEHSSHLLQPLDLTVFPVLKKAYRKEIQQLAEITDDTPMGKAYFLKSYSKAREKAMKPETIRSGWKWSGLWPISMAKPLHNPLLVQQQQKLETNASHTPISKTKMPDTIENTILTSYSNFELRKAVESATKSEEFGCTARLLFRKVGKLLDLYTFEIAELRRKIEVLENQVEHLRPKKKKKVKLGPNELFGNIDAIHETHEKLQKMGKYYTDAVEKNKICQEDLEGECQLLLV